MRISPHSACFPRRKQTVWSIHTFLFGLLYKYNSKCIYIPLHFEIMGFEPLSFFAIRFINNFLILQKIGSRLTTLVFQMGYKEMYYTIKCNLCLVPFFIFQSALDFSIYFNISLFFKKSTKVLKFGRPGRNRTFII